MRAIRLEEPKHFHHVEIDEPNSPGPGEVLVRTHRMGICGTDYSGYLGKMPFIEYPRILGHELGVEVLATGSGVTHLRAGDRCSVEPYLNCGTCHACLRGCTNCCEGRRRQKACDRTCSKGSGGTEPFSPGLRGARAGQCPYLHPWNWNSGSQDPW